MPEILHSEDPPCPRSSMPEILHARDPPCPRSSMPEILHARDPPCPRSSIPKILHSEDPPCPRSSMPECRDPPCRRSSMLRSSMPEIIHARDPPFRRSSMSYKSCGLQLKLSPVQQHAPPTPRPPSMFTPFVHNTYTTGRPVGSPLHRHPRGESVHVFGYEVGRDEYAEGFTPQVLSSMTFHDGFSDPLRWIGVASSLTPQDFTASGILGRLGDSCHPVTIVLDSLSWVLARSPLPSVCHTLRGLTQGKHGAGPRVTRVLALLHTDLHTPGVLRSVCLLAGTVIHVSERGPRDRVTVTHRKRTGKVVTTADPTANLTFNLRLSEADRELKDSASLPYTFTESKKSSLLHSSSSSGRIFYDPDPADDYDDEDPDDDLDV
ncbi:elongator complex protein 5 isoform X2 [Ascaphus truei]|uniref:elongator complex protein 5 isoform X2 n=1 Tax=Ascaphus truei TaxID=8439 RepID=UPI003F59E356